MSRLLTFSNKRLLLKTVLVASVITSSPSFVHLSSSSNSEPVVEKESLYQRVKSFFTMESSSKRLKIDSYVTDVQLTHTVHLSKHPAYPARSRVEKVPWSEKDVNYTPVNYTHPAVIKQYETAGTK